MSTEARSWPYCTGHPDCHAVASGSYLVVGGNAAAGYSPLPIFHMYLGPGRETPGKRLCRSHALIKHRWAIG